MTATVPGTSIAWLLQPSNASARWLALTTLLDRTAGDADVVAARAAIPASPWVKTVMKDFEPEGWWLSRKNLGLPKFTGTMFRLEALADLGMPGDEPRVRTACELFLDETELPGEGFSPPRYKKRAAEECVNGRMLYTFNALGYGDDPRVRAAADWLVANQMLDGGWNCAHNPKARRDGDRFSMDHGCSLEKPHHRSSLFSTMAALKGLATLRKPPRAVIERGVEFLLSHRVYRARSSNRAIYGWPPPIVFPPTLIYDALQPLRVLAMARARRDDRLAEALDHLTSRADRSMRWPHDGAPLPPSRDPAFALRLAEPGKPNKWVTVHALAALRHFGRVSIEGAS